MTKNLTKASLYRIMKAEKNLDLALAAAWQAQSKVDEARAALHQQVVTEVGHSRVNTRTAHVCGSSLDLFNRKPKRRPKIGHCIYVATGEAGKTWTRWCIFCDNPEDDI